MFKSEKINKICAWLLVFFVILTCVVSTDAGIKTVYAEGGEVTYTINRYNAEDIITDSNGVTISGYAYCLDGLCDPPGSSDVYTRVRLSEIDGYAKEYNGNNCDKTLTDDVKSRLMRILIRRDDIINYAKNMDITILSDYIIESYLDPQSTITIKSSLLSSTGKYNRRTKKLSEWKTEYENGAITLDEFKSIASSIIKDYWDKQVAEDAPQRIMWMGIYPEDVRLSAVQTFPDFDPTEYVTQQKKWYTSNDPAHSYVNDDASLWNMFYKPLFDYIDTLPDYYAMGFDAWVYVIDDGNQNIICDAVFLNAKLAKVDDAGNLVEGAVFYIEDEDGNVIVDEDGNVIVDEWESDGQNYLTINNLEIGKKYIISEETTPAGYLRPSEDIVFETGLDNGITLISGQNDAEVLTGGVIKITNDRIFVTIVKTDESGNPIPGAKFELRDVNNKNDSEGRFDDLTKSSYTLYNLFSNQNYTLTELQAPEGYIANGSKISFYIDSDNKVVLNDTYEGVTVDTSTNTISIVNKKETKTEETTTEETTTETTTTETVTTETVTTESLTTDTDITKSTSTRVTTGDKSKPMHAAILMLMSLDAILGMIVFKLLKS